MHKQVRVICSIILLCGATTVARAEDQPPPKTQCPLCRTANNQSAPYAERASVSLVRGMANAAFGWTELLTQPTAEVEQGGNLAVGIGKGLGFAIKRTAVGVGEMFTFWVPKGAQGKYPVLTEDCPICSLPNRPKPPAKPSPTPSSTQHAPGAPSR